MSDIELVTVSYPLFFHQYTIAFVPENISVCKMTFVSLSLEKNINVLAKLIDRLYKASIIHIL